MDEYAVIFLQKPWWRFLVSALGPTLTLNILLQLRAVAILEWLHHNGRFRHPVMDILGFRANILAVPTFFLHLVFHYDREIVPKKAQKLSLFLRLIRQLMVAARLKFAWNLASGTGHTTIELDYFLRWCLLQSSSRPVLLCRPNPFFTGAVRLYRAKLWFAKDSHFLFDLLYPLIAASPELRFDCGQSRAKWQLKSDGSFDPPPPGQTYLYEINKEENILQRSQYFEVYGKTENLHPLRAEPDDDLRAFLEQNGVKKDQRLALIQLKYTIVNATAAPSEPASYEAGIRWLHGEGYRTMMVGRETFPNLFKDLGVINYSESPVASFERDIQLFSMASLALSAGSGLSWMPDCMGKPYLYMDSWHLAMAQPSKLCINVPALLREKNTGKLVSYKEQMRFYAGSSDQGGERLRLEIYEGKNASPIEILEALKELLRLSETPEGFTPLQQKFHGLLPQEFSSVAHSRVSDFFLRQHEDLFSS